jgi:hypothetical protein
MSVVQNCGIKWSTYRLSTTSRARVPPGRVGKRLMKRAIRDLVRDAKRARGDAGRWMVAGRARMMSERYEANNRRAGT